MLLNKLQNITVSFLVVAMFAIATGPAMDTAVLNGQSPQAKKASAGLPAKQKGQHKDSAASETGASKEIELLKRHLAEYKAAFKRAQNENVKLRKLHAQEREEIAGVLTKIDAERNTVSITLNGTKIALNALPLSSSV